MPHETKATLSVAAAFAAALLSAPAVQAEALDTSMPAARTDAEQVQPSPAAIEKLEEAAQTAWFWWPFGPRFVELWPEVTHVETVRTA
jgi:hypothetical protein